MQKTAQERGMLNKLREWGNVSGRAAEAFFNPQFKAVMEHIRQKDDQIRSFVVGKRLGEAEIEPAGPALKDIIKQAKSNINRREFMAAAHDLGIFHERVKNIVVEIGTINDKVDEVHSEFLYKELTPEQKEHLLGFKQRFAQQQVLLIKEAGVMDFLRNIGTTRGRGLAAWEKRYPKKVKELRNVLSSLLNKSENMLATIIGALKDMATARADRNVDDYMKGTAKIVGSFNGYEKSFKEFYKIFSKYVDDLEKYNVSEANKLAPDFDQKPAFSPTINPQVPPPVTTSTPAAVSAPFSVVSPGSPPHAPLPIINPESEEEKTVVEEIPAGAAAGLQTATHQKFYTSLQTLSSESPVMLALFIKKYANSIKLTDPNISSKLFKIAQQIKG
jgi:hypothetical protein